MNARFTEGAFLRAQRITAPGYFVFVDCALTVKGVPVVIFALPLSFRLFMRRDLETPNPRDAWRVRLQRAVHPKFSWESQSGRIQWNLSYCRRLIGRSFQLHLLPDRISGWPGGGYISIPCFVHALALPYW